MKNIIEAGKNIETERAVKLIADMETYTLRNQVLIAAQYLFSYVHAFVGFIAKCAKKEWTPYRALKWEDRHQEVSLEVRKGSLGGSIEASLVRTLEERIPIPKRYQENSDRMSSYLVQFAEKGLGRGSLDGLSIPEKAEYIYEKYPHMKEKNERRTLSLWFIRSCLIALFCMVLSLSMTEGKECCIVLCVVLEIAFAAFISRKMRIRWALHYIWLARSEYGRKLVDATLVLDAMDDEKRMEIKEDLQLLHSYLWLLQKETEKTNQFHHERIEVQKKIEKNTKRMEELQEKEDSDTNSMRKNLWEENRGLKQQVGVLDEKIAETAAHASRIKEQAEEENKNRVEFYLNLWKEYSKIVFEGNACSELLQNLCFADLLKVENRLYELNHVADPLSLAEHKNGRDYLTFRTEQEDIAKIYFSYHPKEQKVCILSMEREQDLNIEPLTSEAIQRILERRGTSDKGNNVDLMQYIKRIEELDAEAEKLRQEKYNASLELQKRVKEISDLTTNMQDSAKKCHALEQELKRVSGDKERAEKILAEYEEKQAELIQLSKETEKVKRELMQWKKKCGELNSKMQRNKENSQHVQTELEAKNKVLRDNIASLESTLNLQKKLADEAKKKRATDRNALKKLENTNKELEKNLYKTKEELSRLEKQKEAFSQKQAEAKKQLAKQKAELEKEQAKARQSLERMKEAQKGVSPEKYHAMYSKVKMQFPNLSDKAVVLFATAEQFFSVFGENREMDYSPIIVEYCKVLELSMWIYLDKSEEYQMEVEEVLKKKKFRTLGSAAYIILQDEKKSLWNYGTDLKRIGIIRNEGAHKGVQGYHKAKEVKTYLWKSDLLKQITMEK